MFDPYSSSVALLSAFQSVSDQNFPLAITDRMVKSQTQTSQAQSKAASSSSQSMIPKLPTEGFSRLTAPAIVAIIGYAILALVVLLPFDMYTYDERTNKYVRNPYRFGNRLLIMILLLFPFFLGVYTVNCMMVGECHIWSWIVAAATLLWACIVILAAISNRAFKLDDMVY